MIESDLTTIQIPPEHEFYNEALHHVFDLSPPKSKENTHPQINLFLQDTFSPNSQSCSNNRLYLYGSFSGNRLISTSLVIESPGTSAMAFIPTLCPTDLTLKGTVCALRSLVTEAWGRGMSLVETLLMPGANYSANIVTQAGFRFITRLLYLRRRISVSKKVLTVANDLEWVSYSPKSEKLFGRILELTYAQSLDCPELTGVRPIEDVLAAHRAVGDHDPSLWWVATRSGSPVGVMLLSHIRARNALEIVYMGVSQAARGTGVADALLDRAVHATVASDARELALAVDRRNAPARRMYARWGFIEFSARDAWIASPSQVNP